MTGSTCVYSGVTVHAHGIFELLGAKQRYPSKCKEDVEPPDTNRDIFLVTSFTQGYERLNVLKMEM